MNKLEEYKALVLEIQRLEAQKPTMEELIKSDDADERYRQIKEQIKTLEGEKRDLRIWLLGYMSACENMKNMDGVKEIKDVIE